MKDIEQIDQKIKKLKEKISKLQKERIEKYCLSVLQKDENYPIIEKYFDYLDGGELRSKQKPDPLLIIHILNRRGGLKELIGFSYDHGYEAAPTFSSWVEESKYQFKSEVKHYNYKIREAEKILEFLETIENDIIQSKDNEE